MPVSLPLLVAGGLAGAVIIDYGVKNLQTASAAATSSTGSSGTGTSTIGTSTGGGNETITGTGKLATGAASGLDPNAQAFAQQLQADTGLSPAVIAGWIDAETSGDNTTNGANNWLNVGSFDDGFEGGAANVWSDPESAADATAAFMLGHPVNGYESPVGNGSSSIRAIVSTAGQSVENQVSAIEDSDWASSHYHYGLMSDVSRYL